MNTQLGENTTVETKEKKKSGTLATVLVLALLLLLLTFVVLASRLYDMATRDKYAVDLGIGMDGEVELFNIEYEGLNDEITVQGVNGENVVAPGTTVSYDIRLRNRDDVIIDFVMEPEAEYLNESPVPIVIKLKDSFGNYILGDDDNWVSVLELNDVTHFGSIHPSEIYTYHLTWLWTFENGEEGNKYDTFLGNQNGEILPGLAVRLNTESTASVGAHGFTFWDNFGCCWCCYVVWLLVLIILALLLWIIYLLRRVKKLKEELEEYENEAEKVLENSEFWNYEKE